MKLPLTHRHASERWLPSDPIQHVPGNVLTTLSPGASWPSIVNQAETTTRVRVGALADAVVAASPRTAASTASGTRLRIGFRSYDHHALSTTRVGLGD